VPTGVNTLLTVARSEDHLHHTFGNIVYRAVGIAAVIGVAGDEVDVAGGACSKSGADIQIDER